jgi:hypothetical protein
MERIGPKTKNCDVLPPAVKGKPLTVAAAFLGWLPVKKPTTYVIFV